MDHNTSEPLAQPKILLRDITEVRQGEELHRDMTVIRVAALLLSLVSVVVTGVLIGVLSVQRVYAHMKSVKRLFIIALIAFIGIDITLLVRRFLPLDEAAAVLVFKLMYSLYVISGATMGCAATVIYKKPRSFTLKEMYAEIVRKMFLPFISFMSILLVFFILCWTLPLSVELRGCPTSDIDLYVPILETHHQTAFSIAFIAFLAYPTAVFWLASLAAKNTAVSRNLRVFAICVFGIAVSVHLQPFFLIRCFAEAVDIIRMACFIVLTYISRRVTDLQSFRDVELKEYIEMLKKRGKQ